MVKPHFLLLLLFLFSFSPLRAQKLKTEKLTFDLYSSIVYLSSPQICPEDDLIAFEVSGYDEDQYFSNIWWYSLKDEESRQITHGMTNQNSHPRFSPDGSYLAFLSDRDDFSQIWLLPMDGGEAELAFEFDYEIESFEWSPDGDSLLFLSKVPQHFQYQSEIKEKPPTTELIISILGEDSYWLNNKKLSFEELATQIKTYSPKKFKNKISLRPHQKVAFKLVLKVQELCKKEGFKEILFEALPEKFPKETPKPKAKKEEETKGKKPIVITRLLFKTDDDGYVENEYQQLFTWNLDTDKITQLTSESYEVDRAIFSPKGDQILFESNRTPKADANYNSDLWLISLKEKKANPINYRSGLRFECRLVKRWEVDRLY